MELISREEVQRIVNDICNHALKTYDKTYHFPIRTITISVTEQIGRLPTIESRPEGVWVGIDEYPHEEWECNNCGNIITTYIDDELEEHRYCHKCGAKMSTPWEDMRGEE